MANKDFIGATQSEKQANCIAYVRQNPSEYLDAYWLINSIKIYVWSAAVKLLWLENKLGESEFWKFDENWIIYYFIK